MNSSRKHIRFRKWDYSAAGAYFVTICTDQMRCFFGYIKDEPVLLTGVGTDDHPSLPYPNVDAYLNTTQIGRMAWKYWREIPQHYPFVILDAFVIMPNHLHGILIFDKPPNKEWKPNTFGPQKGNLGDVIRQYKGTVKRTTNKASLPFKWQGKYFDRVIRNAKEMKKAQEYIWSNPGRWKEKEGSAKKIFEDVEHSFKNL